MAAAARAATVASGSASIGGPVSDPGTVGCVGAPSGGENPGSAAGPDTVAGAGADGSVGAGVLVMSFASDSKHLGRVSTAAPRDPARPARPSAA